MPITINYAPPAAAVGGMALLGGQGEYAKWLTGVRMQQAQMYNDMAMRQQQMNQDRMMAFAQMANQNQQRQEQQFYELQKMPYQAAIESQQQAYHYALAGQNQRDLALLQGQIHQEQSTQDMGEAMRLQSAQGQIALANQQEMAAYNDRLKQEAQMEQLFQNPLAQFTQNQQKAQQSGYSFSPTAQQRIAKLKSDIQNYQDSVANGTATRGTVLPDLRQAVAQLNAMTPDQPPEPPTLEQIQKRCVYYDPQTGGFSKDPKPGTYPVYPSQGKNGEWGLEGIRGLPKGAGEQPEVDFEGNLVPLTTAEAHQKYKDRVEASAIKRRLAIRKELDSLIQQQKVADYDNATRTNNPNAPMLHSDPNWIAQQRAALEAEYAGAKEEAARDSAGANDEARVMGGLPPQQGGAPQPAQPPQQAGGQPQQPTPQQMIERIATPEVAGQTIQQLQQLPLNKWTPLQWAMYYRAKILLEKGRAA